MTLSSIYHLSKKPASIVFGNSLDVLSIKLAEELFLNSTRPFEKRLIIVPSPSIKEYLLYRFAKHPDLQMAAGIQVLSLNQALNEFSEKRIPSFLELSLAIEEKVSKQDLEYLKDESKRKKRIPALSDELARLFARYGSPPEGWQGALWKELFSESSPWTFSPKPVRQFSGKLALFGFSYLPAPILDFFLNLGASFYHLSPCAQFWEDFATAKQKLKRRLDGDDHPLLGNWGKLGREMLKRLSAYDLIEEEVYEDIEGESLLSSLQRSMLQLDESEELRSDDSLQLHSATSKLREVEALRDVLLQSSVPFRDIGVVCPDIASYAPYIQMVFAQYPYSIQGLPIQKVSVGVQGFLQLLKLPEESYALSSMIKLLECGPFLEKSGLNRNEISLLKRGFERAEIRRDLSGSPNSWEAGIGRLLSGLAIVPQEGELYDPWPVDAISLTESDAFNRFLILFDAIQHDLRSLKEKSASDWMSVFLQIADKYFQLEWEHEPFFQNLKSLQLTSQHITDFESIRRVLEHLADMPSGNISTSDLQKITFVPLNLGGLPAFRILWCLGMDESAFPRQEGRSSLSQQPLFPPKKDEDRLLFLELFLKAKERLIFSYQRIDSADSKQQAPSLLIDELEQYLKKRGLTDGMMKVDHADGSPHFSLEEKRPFFVPVPNSAKKQGIVTVRELKKLATHPIRFYFHETLKMFLQDEKDEEEAEFVISGLQKSIVRNQALKSSLSYQISKLRAEGKLPRGLFQETALNILEEEMPQFQFEKIEALSVSLHIENVHIVGKLEDVTPDGLLFHGKDDLETRMKVWPLYLIYRCLNPEHRYLLLTKQEKAIEIPLSNPQAALSDYLDYYFAAKENISPFMPKSAKSILQGNALDVAESPDLYLQYLQRREAAIDTQAWLPMLKKVFHEAL